MELNGIPIRTSQLVAREATQRPNVAQALREDAAAAVEGPDSAPEAGGIQAAFQAEGQAGEDQEDASRERDRLADALDQASLRDAFAEFAKGRLPTSFELSISVDRDTEEARFSVRHRETGEVLREIPERDLLEMLKSGPAQAGRLVDRLF